MSLNSTVLLRILVGLLLATVSASLLAASLTISPVTVTLSEKKHSTAISLKNESSEAKVIQTELLRWTQVSGKNVEAPSRDILVNPPIVTLQPGQTQIIRIGLNRKADKAQELAYRLYVSEVPSPPKEGFTGLRIALRFGLPVFVSPKTKPSNRLDWKAARGPDGALHLTLTNAGNHHVHLNNLKVSDPVTGKQVAESQPAQFTLLAGQAHQISLQVPSGWQGIQLSLLASTDEGMDESKIDLIPPAR